MWFFEIYSGKASAAMVRAILRKQAYGDICDLSPLRRNHAHIGYTVLYDRLTPAGEIFHETLQKDEQEGRRSKMEFDQRGEKWMWYVKEDRPEFETALVLDISSDSQI